jgi:putative hydrolase of the HAD superfamily
MEAKPSTYLFEKVLKRLERMGIPAEETLYVGNDMLNDIYAAQQLGLLTVLFAGDKRSLRLRRDVPQCAGVHPDAVITDLSQLLNLLPGPPGGR